MSSYNFACRLESPNSLVKIPYNISKPIHKLKIKSVSYTTADVTDEVLLLDLQGFAKNSDYLSGNTSTPYSFYMPLNKTLNAQNFYMSKDIDSGYDVINESKETITELTILCLLNGVSKPSNITSLNPVIVEFHVQTW